MPMAVPSSRPEGTVIIAISWVLMDRTGSPGLTTSTMALPLIPSPVRLSTISQARWDRGDPGGSTV